jgi:hypothetical protein
MEVMNMADEKNPMPTYENQSFEIVLDNRLHAVWEKSEGLTLSIYNVNVSWFLETRPTTAPHTLRKLAEGLLEVACELDAIARDVAVEDKRWTEHTAALGKTYTEAINTLERDQLTKRLGEIVRTPHKPSGTP